MFDGWVVCLSSGWSSNSNLLRPWYQLKWLILISLNIFIYLFVSSYSKVYGTGFDNGFPWCLINMAQTMEKKTSMRIICPLSFWKIALVAKQTIHGKNFGSPVDTWSHLATGQLYFSSIDICIDIYIYDLYDLLMQFYGCLCLDWAHEMVTLLLFISTTLWVNWVQFIPLTGYSLSCKISIYAQVLPQC